MGCRAKSKAEKTYQKRTTQTMGANVLLILCTTWLIRHGMVSGWKLYMLAVLPSIPILRLIQVVAMYLREENDEYLRLQVTQSILWGAAAMLALSAFTDFLRSYTPHGIIPPFILFMVFWGAFALSQAVQAVRNRVSDDEPA